MGTLKQRMLVNVFGAILLISGCASQQVSIRGSSEVAVHHDAVPDSLDEYRLQVGDKLSIVCVINEQKRKATTYHVRVGDVITLTVQDRADLSQQYRVGPDGMVQFMMVGAVKVAGLSLDELRRVVREGYVRVGVEDFLSVGLAEFDLATSAFIRDLTAGMNGREPFSTMIALDGQANFPLIGFVKLAGMKLQEANHLVAGKYQEHFQTLDLTLRIEQSSGHNITVLGEVIKPGAYPISGTLTVLSALGASGGYTSGAKLDSIMTVQRRGDQVFVNKFNLETDLFAMASHKLIAGDFVFVPMTSIANVNQFVDQYLRRNIPIGLGATATYRIR